MNKQGYWEWRVCHKCGKLFGFEFDNKDMPNEWTCSCGSWGWINVERTMDSIPAIEELHE